MEIFLLICVACIFVALQMKTEKNRQEEEARKEEILRQQEEEAERIKQIQKHKANISKLDENLILLIRDHFKPATITKRNDMESVLKNVNFEVTELVRLGCKDEETKAVEKAKQIIKRYDDFVAKGYVQNGSFLLDMQHYGQIQKDRWDRVRALNGLTVRSTLNNYLDQTTTTEGVFKLLNLDPSTLLEIVWFYAMKKPFSAEDYQSAVQFYSRVFKNGHIDLLISDLYAKSQVGGEEVLQEQIRNLLKEKYSEKYLTTIASSLMWMKAYKSESMVLQYMLSNGMEMDAKTQERLHSLTNGGGEAPSGFDVKSSASLLYFDVSALAWRDDEYIGLFENLAFQDKTLAYSLALRDENKDLFIPQGINVPNTGIVLDKFKSVLSEEYGSGVVAQVANCIALSGSGEERLDGILVSANECKQMGILIHIARIGKKLIIKFYTLFMPTGSDLAAQKQQALSMYKKLSPTVTMWESSLKDTMLMAVERLLNTKEGPKPEPSDTGDDLIF